MTDKDYDEIDFGDGERYEEPEQEPNQDEPQQEPDETPGDPDLENEDEDEPEEEPKEQPKYYQDSDEEMEKAKAGGWTPFEEWVKQGKPANEWKTARHFNEVGELYNNMRSQKKENSDELQATKALMDIQINNLKEQQKAFNDNLREAVESGNYEAVQEITNKINQNTANQYVLESTKNNSEQNQRVQQEIEWEKSRPWFNVKDPNDPNYQKSMHVAQTYQQLLASGKSFDEAITLAEQHANAKFPPSNPNRDKPSVTDNKQGTRKKGGAKNFNELPPEAKKEYERYSDVFKNKSDFVKAWNNLNKG